MLIYNYQKEFVGIDEADLKALGFSDLSQLRNESADFADLFVKTPGFVHNFKHVHWIDFVTCAEGSEDAKVVIHASGKNYRCTLDIKTAYLVDDPSQKAYIINLVKLRALTHTENEQISDDILQKTLPRVSSQNTAIFSTPTSSSDDYKDNKVVESQSLEDLEVTHDPYEVNDIETLDELNLNKQVVEDIYEKPLEVDESDNGLEEQVSIEEAQSESEPIAQIQRKSQVSSDYVYDPILASDELGLPIDLIEEFIQDFISQANDFKDDLYSSLNESNGDNVKILSHKLKGVAANLRIEDAFEVLTTINTSNDNNEIKTNLDTFYTIIDKLSGKDHDNEKPLKEAPKQIKEDEEDDLVISFKDDIDDSQVPQKIQMPELADDDFLKLEDEVITLDALDDIDEVSLNEEMPTIEESNLKYDKSAAASEIGIDEQSFNVLFSDYLVESKNACLEIQSAVEEKTPAIWKQSAIKLKGMSDNMRIYDYTQELESIINTQDHDIAKEAIDAITHKLQQISDREV